MKTAFNDKGLSSVFLKFSLSKGFFLGCCKYFYQDLYEHLNALLQCAVYIKLPLTQKEVYFRMHNFL